MTLTFYKHLAYVKIAGTEVERPVEMHYMSERRLLGHPNLGFVKK